MDRSLAFTFALARGRCAAVLVLLVLVGCGGAADTGFFSAAPPSDAAPDAPITPPLADAGDGAAALALFSSAGIDFGLVDCGGSAPPNQTLTLRNLGAQPLTWNASLSASDVFALVDPSSGTIAAGGSATVSISAQAVAANALAGATSQALLTVTTNDALHPKSDLPVTLTPGGGALAVTPATVSFGQVPLNAQAPDLPIAVTNTGNKPLAVNFMPPSNPEFELRWTSSPASITLQPGASVPGLVARFHPVVTTVATTVSSIATTGVLCGSVPTVKLTGQGTVGAVTVSPAELFFGQVNCNTTALPQKVRIANGGVGSFQFNAVLGLGSASPYTISPSTGTVTANGFIDIDVVPTKIPARSLTTDDLYADTMTVTTLGIPGDPPHTILLHETARGARLALSVPSIAFSDVPVQTTTSSPFTVTNSGNTAATVTLATAAPFTVSPSAGSIVFPNGAGLAASATFAPLATGNASGTVTLSPNAGTVLCADLPAPITLGGRGTNGQVSVSTTTLDFSQVSCGTTAAPQSFTLTNSGTAAFTWSGTLGRGAASPYAFTFSPGGAGTLNPTQAATITVTPKMIPAISLTTTGLYNDTLTIQSSAVGDTGTVIQLGETARGAILAFTPPTIPFGGIPVTQTLDRTFQLVNSGNLAASVTLASSNAHFTISPAGPAIVANGTPLDGTATFAPGATTATQNAIVSVTTAAVLCAPLPALNASGTGTNGVLFVTPSPIDFGLTDCGTGAPARTVRIRNDGNGAFGWSLATAASSYTLNPSSGTALAPNAFVDVNVSSAPIPATSAVTPNLYGDTLNVTTTINGAGSTRAVPITQTARGVILVASVPSIDFGNVSILGPAGTSPIRVTNNGNVAGAISLTTTNNVFGISPASASLAAGGGFVAATASFTPTVPGPQNGALGFTVSNAAVCGNVQVALTGQGTP